MNVAVPFFLKFKDVQQTGRL